MSKMKKRQILFNGDNIITLLAKRKTMTRRVVKGESLDRITHWRKTGHGAGWEGYHESVLAFSINCPYGLPGQELVVRETWAAVPPRSIHYRADNSFGMFGEEPRLRAMESTKGWRPSIFMPWWASRFTLEVTDVRIERLHAITYEDILAEGLVDKWEQVSAACIRMAWRSMWNSINEANGYPWTNNDWVWAVTFKEVEVE